MKKIIFLMATPLIMMACNNAKSGDSSIKEEAASTTVNKQERNKKVVQESLDNFLKGNFDGVFKDVAPGFTDYGDGSMAPITNIDSMKAMFTMFTNSLENYKGEDVKYYTDGDYVLVQGNWVANFNKDLLGIKATHRPVKFWDVDIFKLNDDGKITEHRSVQNVGAVLITESLMKK